MSGFIGISEDRVHHILGVARECYRIAKDKGYDEDFCRRMWMIGWNHDVGYEFSEKQSEHPYISESLLKLINVRSGNIESSKVLHSIRKHGLNTNTKSAEWIILNMADLTIDDKGNKVDILKRLEGIKQRYDKDSNQYLTACDVAYDVGLTNVDFIDNM